MATERPSPPSVEKGGKAWPRGDRDPRAGRVGRMVRARHTRAQGEREGVGQRVPGGVLEVRKRWGTSRTSVGRPSMLGSARRTSQASQSSVACGPFDRRMARRRRGSRSPLWASAPERQPRNSLARLNRPGRQIPEFRRRAQRPVPLKPVWVCWGVGGKKGACV